MFTRCLSAYEILATSPKPRHQFAPSDQATNPGDHRLYFYYPLIFSGSSFQILGLIVLLSDSSVLRLVLSFLFLLFNILTYKASRVVVPLQLLCSPRFNYPRSLTFPRSFALHKRQLNLSLQVLSSLMSTQKRK